MQGALLGGTTCLPRMPWRTRIPGPPIGASQMPPPPSDSKGAPQHPVATDEGAATRSRSRSKGGKGGSRPAQRPPAPPKAEQAMIASLQRQIASLEGVINTLRRELAE